MTSSETGINPYNELDLDQALSLRETLQNRYYDAMEYLGAVAADKAHINNHIQELIQKELRSE